MTYQADELCATKLRALYQRSKGRDLFDLATALEHGLVDPDAVVRPRWTLQKRPKMDGSKPANGASAQAV